MGSIRFGIREQVVFGIVVITIAAISFMGIISISILEKGVLSSKIREAEKTARMLGSIFDRMHSGKMPSPFGSDYGYAKSIMKDMDISALHLKDASGATLIREGKLPESEGELLFMENGIMIYRTKRENIFPELYVISGEGLRRQSGLVFAFTLPLSDIKVYTGAMRKFIIFYAVLDSLIIIAIGVYFLSRFVIRPVKRLESAAREITGGNLDIRVGVEGRDEFSSLASAFNAMAERIQEEIERLGKVNRELGDAREELLKASMLMAVGRLAAGIAHEIGNPLGAISGYVSILERSVSEEEKGEILKRMEKEVERINKIVGEFLELARPSPAPLKPVDVNLLVSETITFLKAGKDFEGVDTELLLKENLPPVIINEDKLKQVFMNILLNAIEAMEGRGIVTISTRLDVRFMDLKTHGRRRKGDVSFASIEGMRERQYVVISFKDAGSGISREDMDKIFDPFFTTKEGGRGTGLGLFISQNIIKSYGGTIEVESAPSGGSTFSVVLPSDGKPG